MIKVHFRALKPEESPARWSERVFCESVAFRDMASPYLSGWRENRYGPDSKLHRDHDHSKCRHRAKFEANGVKICGRHLNTLCTELIFANLPLEITFENMEPSGVLMTLPLDGCPPSDPKDWREILTDPDSRYEKIPTRIICNFCFKDQLECRCGPPEKDISVQMTVEGLKVVGSPCWPVEEDRCE